MSDIPPARDFDYMPSRNIGRRRHSFSLLSGSRTLPFIYRPSLVIGTTASTFPGEQYSSLENSPRSSRRQSKNSPRPAPSSSSQPTQPPSTPPRRNRPRESHDAPSASTSAAPQKSIEDERFAYRALRAMKMATATKLAIADEESHLLSRIKEEEFVLEMLQEEAELARARKNVAIDQLDTIREGVESFGVKLPSDEELEAFIRRPHPGISRTPPTPTRTPPVNVYWGLLDKLDVSERSGSSASDPRPSSLSSISLLPPRPLSPTPKAPGSPSDNQSPLLDAPGLDSGAGDDT